MHKTSQPEKKMTLKQVLKISLIYEMLNWNANTGFAQRSIAGYMTENKGRKYVQESASQIKEHIQI